MKKTVDTCPTKNNSPQTISSVFIAKSDGTIFKPQQLSKPNAPSKAVTKKHLDKNIVTQTFSTDSKQNFEWRAKSVQKDFANARNTVIPTTSKRVGPRKVVSKQPIIEYDFWINEKTLVYCFFLEGSRK